MQMIRVLFIFFSYLYLPTISASDLISTESDPDAFIQNCVNVINGSYCEATTDFLITGPDALLLQRFYTNNEGWKIFPERFLVIGKDSSPQTCKIENEYYDWTLALIGERSGGILPYSGWRSSDGSTKDPLKIDVLNQAVGLVNTYATEVSGQTNHQNNQLHCQEDICELSLGDGSKRIYKHIEALPSLVLGEQLLPVMATKVFNPAYYLLTQEVLPSGNQLFFSYDEANHLIAIELKNSTNKILSWIRISYEFGHVNSQINMKTSDNRELTYHLIDNQLVSVNGSHSIPTNYKYEGNFLIKKELPEGRFVEVVYQNNKVQSLKGPHAQSGKAEIVCSFSYSENYTDVCDALEIKTRYIYDKRSQLIAIEYYDNLNKLYRIEQKFWGTTVEDIGFLLAKTVSDGDNHIYSYRSFQYDKSGNVNREKLYGNLTGKQKASLNVSSEGKLLSSETEECHVKTFEYSSDGFNLLTKIGDCKGNYTLYAYKAGTNLLIKKLIHDKGTIKKRTFHFYNEDAVCIKIVEDDGYRAEEVDVYGHGASQRYIKEIYPKMTSPGLGLPETIQEKAFDLKTKKEILIKKIVNFYDSQSNLISCDIYDANDEYAFSEKKSYTHLGQLASETNAAGKEVIYSYDEIGNEISRFIPNENRLINTTYDFHNKPIQIIENNSEEIIEIYNTYDSLGRKTTSTDRFGQKTHYEYDSFHRLTLVIHPEVLDEHEELIHPTFSYTYDIFGNVLESIDAKGFVTKKTYNLRGNPTRIFYPDGSSEFFKYDPEGSLHRSLNKEKIITVYEYDYLGRLIYEESSVAGETGVESFLKSKTYYYNSFQCIYEKEKNYTKFYSYDLTGKIIAITQCDDNQWPTSRDARLTELIYDSLGRVQQYKVWFDVGPQDYSLECYSYDCANNVIEKRIENAANIILLHKYYTYNLQGQCEEEYILENGIKKVLVKTIYNSQGEPICYIDGLDQETKIIIDNHYLNTLGQKVLKKTIINSLGIQTEMEFDALSRLYSLSKKDSFGFLLSSQKFLYDALGNTSLEIQDQVINGEIISSQKTQRIYGPMGRLEEENHAVGTSLSKKIHYEYNSLGKLISKNLAETSLQYTYHKNGNLHKIESRGGKQKNQISNSYSYDCKGNITFATSLPDKYISRVYNAYNQIIKETVRDKECFHILEYFYDRKGRLKTLVLPDQSKISYKYDAVFGREVNRVSSTGEILYTHTYDSYSTQGQLIAERHIGDINLHEYTYNLNSQKIASKSKFFNEEYMRDTIGRITEVKGEKSQSYIYNGLSQLISEKKYTYLYDSLDNRIQSNNEQLVYNAFNQLVSHANTEFLYDNQGNLSSETIDAKETNFESNIFAQLTSIEKPDQTAINFTYDPFGRLLVETLFNNKEKNKTILSTTRYLYLGYQEIGTLYSQNKIESLKIPGLHGDELSLSSVAFELKGKTYVPLHDVAGNVTCLIDPHTQQIIESYDYTAFGQVTVFNKEGRQENTSLIDNPWQFAEKRLHQKSGLILFGFRFYNPTIGRWINQDPLGNFDGPNLYAYLHNNPLNYLDRFGLSTESNSQNKFEGYMYGEYESHCYCEKHRTCKRGGDIGKTLELQLPKITYDDSFEKIFKHKCTNHMVQKDYYDNSIYYDFTENGLKVFPNHLGIGFINGILNDYKGNKESAAYISRLAGGYNIHSVYNATHGSLDLVECWMGLDFTATAPVRQLHNMWNSFFNQSPDDAKFLMICHSQGAIHTMNALLDYPPEIRDRILVVGIAPGAYMYKKTCSKAVYYRAEWWRDFVPRLDRDGSEREKDTITTIESHQNAPAFDHPFMSPSYEDSLQFHINMYIQSEGRNL